MTGDAIGTGIGELSSGPWIRHPTDVMIPPESPYDAYVTYELTARVARVNLNITDHEKTYIGTNAVVTCLSCHKAHASEYPDMLRFDYGNIKTGGGESGTGCFACHGDK